MRLETDYLVVGAGASGMAFVDALVDSSDADVVMVDRRPSPGGHWHDAYPFVRLHQPAAAYGVASTPLGQDRIDSTGDNVGMYELASSAEICRYYAGVLDQLLRTGRVKFLPMHDFRESETGTYEAVSLLTGDVTTIHVRKKLVDATYIEPEIPVNRPPRFEVGTGATVIPPNDLVRVRSARPGSPCWVPARRPMDACTWLLENDVPQGSITWVRSRDVWAIDRAWTQPLDLVHTRARFNAEWLRAAAEASDGNQMALALEEAGIFVRMDDGVPPTAFRGATISRAELAKLRTIEKVVQRGRVRRVDRDGMTLTGGNVPQPEGQLYVDCTPRDSGRSLPRRCSRTHALPSSTSRPASPAGVRRRSLSSRQKLRRSRRTSSRSRSSTREMRRTCCTSPAHT